jgi:hypothetical protein
MYFLEQGHPTFRIIFHPGNYGNTLQLMVKKWLALQIIITAGGKKTIHLEKIFIFILILKIFPNSYFNPIPN